MGQHRFRKNKIVSNLVLNLEEKCLLAMFLVRVFSNDNCRHCCTLHVALATSKILALDFAHSAVPFGD